MLAITSAAKNNVLDESDVKYKYQPIGTNNIHR